ncbi:DUF1385 domain-containing protein [Candidatus Woesearchaeota archaeon]|nr:DUF1385 domain-containing protein [Candidatus Woesearchaeota archaeon]
MANNSLSMGGQAVIEGVMIRSKNKLSIAVRKQGGGIKLKTEKLHLLGEKYPVLQWPLLRGIIGLIEMMVIGIKALNYSANVSLEEEEEKLSGWHIAVTLMVATLFAIALFKVIPLLLSQFLQSAFSVVKNNYFLFNLSDGIFRILLFVAYLYVISLTADVKRLFMYHGAEHMAVHCYEAKKKLTVENVKQFHPEHPRCGTSFILIVFILSILVYSFIPSSFSFWAKLGLRLALLPLIAGISYEVLKLAGRFYHTSFFRIISWPGMAVQKITTRQPTDDQVEVAIKAVKGIVG